MSKEEVEALTLFKDFTMLQLKSYLQVVKSKSTGIGGAMENYEEGVINRALDLYRTYTSLKLDKNGK